MDPKYVGSLEHLSNNDVALFDCIGTDEVADVRGSCSNQVEIDVEIVWLLNELMELS